MSVRLTCGTVTEWRDLLVADRDRAIDILRVRLVATISGTGEVPLGRDSEDLAQDYLMRLVRQGFRPCQEWQGGLSMMAILRMIARRLVMTAQRGSARERNRVRDLRVGRGCINSEGTDRPLNVCYEFFEELPEPHNWILLLRYEGRSVEEISAAISRIRPVGFWQARHLVQETIQMVRHLTEADSMPLRSKWPAKFSSRNPWCVSGLDLSEAADLLQLVERLPVTGWNAEPQ